MNCVIIGRIHAKTKLSCFLNHFPAIVTSLSALNLIQLSFFERVSQVVKNALQVVERVNKDAEKVYKSCKVFIEPVLTFFRFVVFVVGLGAATFAQRLHLPTLQRRSLPSKNIKTNFFGRLLLFLLKTLFSELVIHHIKLARSF